MAHPTDTLEGAIGINDDGDIVIHQMRRGNLLALTHEDATKALIRAQHLIRDGERILCALRDRELFQRTELTGTGLDHQYHRHQEDQDELQRALNGTGRAIYHAEILERRWQPADDAPHARPTPNAVPHRYGMAHPTVPAADEHEDAA